MRRFTTEQRRVRLARRHHLARSTDDLVGVAGDLCGLHSSDAATVMLSARARVDGFTVEHAEQALYEDRTLARILAMRRTMFVVPTEDVATFHAASTRALVGPQRRRVEKLLAGSDVTDDEDPATWLARVEEATMAALRDRGEAVATQLSSDVPELARKVTIAPEKRWGGQFGMSTRVLFLLATEARIVRGRPRGTWLSTQYRWAPTDTWFDGRVDIDAVPSDRARADLAARWLATFGPATVEDLTWWTGWTKTQTRKALAVVEPTEVDIGGRVGLLVDEAGDDATPSGPWVALLPSLDPTVMGWKDRDFFLDPAMAADLFDRNGNVGPTVWADGRVVGGWAQRPDGEVVVRLLTDVGRDTAAAVDAEAVALSHWLGEVRVIPRFRTPLEKALSAPDRHRRDRDELS